MPAWKREPDILDLTEEMKAEPIEAVSVEEPEPPPVFRTIDGQPDVFFAEARRPSLNRRRKHRSRRSLTTFRASGADRALKPMSTACITARR